MPTGYPATIEELRPLLKNFGTCLNFSSGGKVSLGTANPFTGDFYISMWVKWNGLNGAYQHLFAKRDSYASDGMMFDLALVDTTGNFIIDTNVSSDSFVYKFLVGKWTHVCFVQDATNTTKYMYIDGEKYLENGLTAFGTGTGAEITIGAIESGASEPFNGKIDEVVIGQYAPTWQDVLAIKNKYIYPEQWSYLKLDEGSGATATDSSGNGNNGTITTATYSTDKILTTRSTVTNRFSIVNSTQKSLLLNGTSDYGTLSAWTPDVNGFNCSLWVLVNAGIANGACIIDWATANNTDGMKITLDTAARTFSILICNGAVVSGNITTGNSGIKWRYGIWYHIAVTWVPNNLKIYLNASSVGSDSSSIMSVAVGQTLTIGRDSFASSRFFKGYIKDFSFINTTTIWTSTDVNNIYYKRIFPSGVSLYDLNNRATDQNGENTLTLTGTSYSTNVPSHFGVRSLI